MNFVFVSQAFGVFRKSRFRLFANPQTSYDNIIARFAIKKKRFAHEI